jgi:MFS family permease
VTANPRLLVVLSALHFSLFPIPIITLYWKDQIGMSLTDIMVLQAVFGVAIVVLEFPSGYLADRVGHRFSLLVGVACWGVGWAIYSVADRFAGVLAAEIVLGAASAFISGADRALLWTSLEVTGRRRQYTRWEGRFRAAQQVAESASAAAGGYLYTIAPRLPFWAQVPTAGLALLTVARLRETPRQESAVVRSHVARALRVVRFTLWHHRRLSAAIGLSVALGLSTFVMVWLIQPAAQARGVPAAWFGPLWAAAHACLALVSLAAGRVVGALGVRGTLLGCCLLVPVGYLGLMLTTGAWGLAFYLCFMTIRGLQGPVLMRLMQEDAPDDDRASVLSLAALLFRLSFVLVGPPVGALVDRAGMSPAFGILALGFTAATLAALSAFWRAHGGGAVAVDGDIRYRPEL